MSQFLLDYTGYRNEFAIDVAKGKVLATRGVVNTFTADEISAAIARHMALDWRDMDREDREANLDAAMTGRGRVFGAFRVRGDAGERCDLWIITEANRRETTALLPEEY